MNSFGMESMMPFVPPPPVVVQKQPQGDGGKGGEDWLTSALGIASLIPGPQQPFVAGASALNKAVQGGIKGNPMALLGGLSQLGGLEIIKNMFGSGGGVLPGAASGLTSEASNALMQTTPGLSVPSFGGYNFQYNPYETSFYPFFGR